MWVPLHCYNSHTSHKHSPQLQESLQHFQPSSTLVSNNHPFLALYFPLLALGSKWQQFLAFSPDFNEFSAEILDFHIAIHASMTESSTLPLISIYSPTMEDFTKRRLKLARRNCLTRNLKQNGGRFEKSRARTNRILERKDPYSIRALTHN